jgi:HIRAN domain
MMSASSTRSFTLVEGSFDPDGEKGDLEWAGFHIHDERGAAVSYDDATEFNLQIFRVAGVSHRTDVLQRPEFNPGELLKLLAEYSNPYDRNAVSVWDRAGTLMIGYVPKD